MAAGWQSRYARKRGAGTFPVSEQRLAEPSFP